MAGPVRDGAGPTLIVYVVTGWPRTGTTLLTRCVDAAGIPAIVTEQRIAERPGYRHQPPGGYWQPEPGWPRGPADVRAAAARVVKVFAPEAERLPRVKGVRYRVALTSRDWEEVWRSYHAAVGGLSRYDSDEAAGWAARMAARRDVDGVVEVPHRELVLDVERALGRLVSAGWPLDPGRARGIPDRRWWRHRIGA